MRLAAAVAAIVVTGAGSSLLAQPPAGATPGASRVVDRTVSCTVGLTGGLHKIQVSANSGTRLFGKPSVWKYLASIGAGDSSGGGGGGVQAGNPAAPLAPGLPYPPERLSLSAPPVCKPAPRIPLSKAGLVAEAVPALAPQDGVVQCSQVPRFAVRVRGIFSAPTSLRTKRDHSGARLVASGTVTAGYLAVRSSAGKPLAYADVFQNGKARLYVSRSCSG